MVTEQQVPFHDRQANLGGRLDAIAHWKDDPGHRFPVEVKSAAPHIWDKINTPADFNFKPWLKKYVPQIMSYMLFHRADGYQDGVIILINKSTGLLKEIWFDLDLDYMDVLLEKCRRVNAAVYRYEAEIDGRDDRLPARITDISTCEMCDFRHICRPETDFGSELVISDDPEFDQKLKRMLENKEALAEAAALEKEVKDRLKATAEKAGANDYKYLTPDALVMGKKDARGAWRWTFTKAGEPAAESEE